MRKKLFLVCSLLVCALSLRAALVRPEADNLVFAGLNSKGTNSVSEVEVPKRALRIMSYNTHNGVGMDGKTDYQRIAAVIRQAAPDLVALQELDSMTHRSNQRDVLLEIAKHTGMYPAFAPAIDYDGGKYGIGILSKEKPLRHFNVPLPGREESRTMLVAEFERYVYCCTHLSLTEADRLASIKIIKEVAAQYDKPFILAGDMNAEPEDAFMQAFSKEFTILSTQKKKTFPADQPDVLLDYIAVNKDNASKLVVTATQVVSEPEASDHRPVVADVMLKQTADKIFRTEPYLQNPTGNGITVMWQTTVPSYSWVEYGTDKEHLEKARTLLDGQAVCGELKNKIRLSGLQPGQTYYYRICSQEIMVYGAYRKVFGETAVSDFHTFTLPAAGQQDFTAIVFNDLHKHSATFQALYQQVKDIPYDFVIFNGDCIDDPKSHDEATRFLQELNGTVRASDVPAFYIRGNHEIRGAYSVGLHDLFDYVGDKTYSAFNWGDTRIVILDCGEDKPDSTAVYYGLNDFSQLRKDQQRFLKEELASKAFKKAKRRVLLHHVPVYGLDVDYTDYNPCLELWGPLLAKAPFDIALNAHTHKYAYHAKKSIGNNYPVVVGGGYSMKSATVMILQKKGEEMTLRVLNTKGETLLNLSL